MKQNREDERWKRLERFWELLQDLNIFQVVAQRWFILRDACALLHAFFQQRGMGNESSRPV